MFAITEQEVGRSALGSIFGGRFTLAAGRLVDADGAWCYHCSCWTSSTARP